MQCPCVSSIPQYLPRRFATSLAAEVGGATLQPIGPMQPTMMQPQPTVMQAQSAAQPMVMQPMVMLPMMKDWLQPIGPMQSMMMKAWATDPMQPQPTVMKPQPLDSRRHLQTPDQNSDFQKVVLSSHIRGCNQNRSTSGCSFANHLFVCG
jgi:hypothetical protein